MSAADLPLGLRYDMPIETYHGSGLGISKSGLDDIAESPALFYALHLASDRPEPKDKPGRLEGALAHCSILEPHEFDNRYAVGPEVNRNTKVWKEFVENCGARIPIQPPQYEVAMRQAESVRRLPEIREALQRGRAEVSAYWSDASTGELCRCRPDFVHDANDSAVILLDVKTYTTSDPREFARQVARKRYFVQDSWYSDGYSIASGKEVAAFVFVAVSSDYPFLACATMLDDPGKEQGRRTYRRDLDTYAACKKSGIWPGPGDAGIHLISMPRWAMQEDE